MLVYLIRHGMTQGNIEKRYVGRTDEPLADSGKAELKMLNYPDCDAVYISPMIRCRETADIIYPGKTKKDIYDFRECDFGEFEGHNYIELSDNAKFQRWIDSGGNMDFPGGEGIDEFKKRCIAAFESVINDEQDEQAGNSSMNRRIALVVHGGTIMALLEHYEHTHEYYKWQTANGHGFACEWTDGELTVTSDLMMFAPFDPCIWAEGKDM